MSASDELKETYTQQAACHQYGEHARTITHLLHWFNPCFLELEAKWVDALLEAENDERDKFGYCNLVFLFRSKKLKNFDFDCYRFQKLL